MLAGLLKGIIRKIKLIHKGLEVFRSSTACQSGLGKGLVALVNQRRGFQVWSYMGCDICIYT